METKCPNCGEVAYIIADEKVPCLVCPICDLVEESIYKDLIQSKLKSTKEDECYVNVKTN